MEEPSDELHEKQRHGRSYGKMYTLAFGNGLLVLSHIDNNNNNNNNNNNIIIIIIIVIIIIIIIIMKYAAC